MSRSLARAVGRRPLRMEAEGRLLDRIDGALDRVDRALAAAAEQCPLDAEHPAEDWRYGMTVLVTGATGNVGSQVVQELRREGTAVRALVRDAARARERLGDDVELAVGDLSDRASLQRALVGIDRVFLSSADGPQKVAQETAVIDAAAALHVRLIVKASTRLAQVGSPLPAFDWHGQIEEHLWRSEVPAVILQSSFYMTNLLAAAQAIREAGKLPVPAGQGRVAMIDPRDTGMVAAAVLRANGHEGRTYVLTGPDALSYHEVAEALSAVIGRRIDYLDVPEQAAETTLQQVGMPDWLVRQLLGAFRLIREGRLGDTTDTVRVLSGREPRPFAEFVRQVAPLLGADEALRTPESSHTKQAQDPLSGVARSAS